MATVSVTSAASRKPGKIVARWTRTWLKKNGWKIRPDLDVPDAKGYWNYLNKYDDKVFTFSLDGIEPNEYMKTFGNDGYFAWESVVNAGIKDDGNIWDRIYYGTLPPDEPFGIPQKKICVCDSHQLTWLGHNVDCIEKKK